MNEGSARVVVPRLVVTHPPELAGRILALTEAEMIVGHSDTADLVLDNRFVSRRHALISVSVAGAVTVRDLNSTGGTFVNDERIDGARVLAAGDLVRFTDLVARFEPGPTLEPATVPVPTLEPATAPTPVPVPVPVPSGSAAVVIQRQAAGGQAAGEERRYVVEGHVTWTGGQPVAGIVVRAVDQDLRTEQPLGPHAPDFADETRTDEAGYYSIPYTRAQFARAEIDSADLIVRVLGSDGSVAAASPIMFNAQPQVTIDLQVSGAVAGQPSEYQRVVARVEPLVADADPPVLTSLRDSDETFLVGETGLNKPWITALLSAVDLARGAQAIDARGAQAIDAEVPLDALYGLVREGVTATWPALLGLRDAGIAAALTAAASAGIVPPVLAAEAERLAALIASVAARLAVASQPAGGTMPLAQLFTPAGLTSAQQETLITAAAAADGTPDEFWASLAGQPGFTDPAQVARLQLTVQLGLLTGNHAPLVQLLLTQKVSSPANLVLLDTGAWERLLATSYDGQPVGVPPGVPGATPAEREANYIAGIMGTLQAAFPTRAVANLAAANTAIITDPDVRAGVASFLASAPGFDIASTRISSYLAGDGQAALATVPEASRAAVTDELKRLQRAFQISLSADSMSALLTADLDAAHKVANVPRQLFIDQYSEALGGDDVATGVYERATFVNSRSVAVITQFNETLNGVYPTAISGGRFGWGGSGTQQQLIQAYPDFTELFGALDPCNCDDCTSAISPVAYFVDLLQFLSNSLANSEGYTPLDVLIGGGKPPLSGRRPDLAYLKLTCENATTELPYIDLVNEVLESYIAYSGPSVQAAHDTGDVTSTQLEASPQYTLDARITPDGHTGPYFTLSSATFPFTLPYNQPIAVARTYLGSLGTSRYQVLKTFQTDPAAAAAAIAAEYLGMDPYLYQLLTGTDLTGAAVTNPALHELYGYPAGTAGWEATVSAVPTFLSRTGITITDLASVLATTFVNPNAPAGADLTFMSELPFGYPTLMTIVNAGFTTSDPTITAGLTAAGITLAQVQQWWERHPDIGQMLVIYSPDGSCDITDATIAQLANANPPTDAGLDALQAFIRLWQVLGWSIADTGRAFAALGAAAITPAFVADLATIAQLQGLLSPPSLQVLFALWADLDYGTDDSLYDQLFLNPAALPNDPAFALDPVGAVLTDPAQTISGHVPALVAALGVSATDLSLICADAGIAESAPLTLAAVSALYRYAALALALSMTVSDFITLKGLAGPSLDPFAGPGTALAFVKLAQTVQQSGFSVGQLAYLYQHVSAPPTGLAPQQTTLAVLAQTLRDGLAQIAAQCAIVPDPKGTATTSAITQLISKEVATQAVGWVNGTAISSTPLATLPAAIAKVDGSGAVTGVDPAKTPAGVGAKLTYDPVGQMLGYTGAMTTQEHADLQLVSSDAGYQAALTQLFAGAPGFMAGNLAPLLNDPNAATTLFLGTASLDGQLNPVLVDAGGNVVTDPALAANTAIAAKFGYLLGTLMPYLRNLLSHTLAKQTIADTFGLDPSLTSLLIETVLAAPSAPAQPLVGDLLALADGGATASYYPTPDLSGAPASTGTATEVDFGGAGAAALPAGTQSASFTSWIEAPASATFTFTVQTNGRATLFVGDQVTPVISAASGQPSATVTLTAGTLSYLRLDVTGLPAGTGTVVLSWQNASTPSAPVPAAVQLPGAVFTEFGLAYVRIQKAALLASVFALTSAEIGYLSAAGAAGLFAGFSLNALPRQPGISAAQATALFGSWQRLAAYVTLRSALPNGSVTLVDVFTATTAGAAEALIPQATGWDAAVVTGLLPLSGSPGSTAPNPFTDEIKLTAMQAGVNLVSQAGASPAQLLSWAQYAWASPDAAYDGLHAIAADIKNAAASRYDPSTWPGVAGPLSDTMRDSQRDALVAYLMGLLGYTDQDDLFELLLIDPQMGTCMQTSRIAQAINSVQLFVQRCLLNMETGVNAEVSVSPAAIDAPTWQTWMGAYALWAANREVFFWPENWLLPSLRDDQTPLFTAFASSLQQGTISDQSVSDAYLTYLQGLEQVDRLDIRTVFVQAPDPNVQDSPSIVHVIGRTMHVPRVYFYRQQISGTGWTPWQQVQADIEDDHLIAAIWEGRLRLIWPVFTQQSYAPPADPGSLTTTDSNGNQTPVGGSPAMDYWQITLAWSEYYQGAWQQKQVSDDYMISFFSILKIVFDPDPQAPPQDAHVFKARIDGADLVVDVYTTFSVADDEAPDGTSTIGPLLLGEFRFSACGDSVSVTYGSPELGFPDTVLAPSPNQTSGDLGASTLLVPPNTGPYKNGFREDGNAGLTLPTAAIDGDPVTGNPPDQQLVTYLNASPTQYELRVSQQNWQFGLQYPFFYQDQAHTFFVQPAPAYPIASQLGDSASVDLPSVIRTLAGQPPQAEPAAAASIARPSPALTLAGPRTGPANWSAPQQSPGRAAPSTVLLSFQTHRHPYVCQLIENLVSAQGQEQSGGIDGLLNIASQNLTNGFDFKSSYVPDATHVETPYPAEDIDFCPGGAYSDYNWELFFHGPLLTAITLSQNQQFAEADTWFRYIFNPTDSEQGVAVPDRYWQVQPFRDGVPQTLSALLQAIDAGDASALAQLNEWYQHPFEPFPIARLRIGAFQKYAFMAYLDNLIAWGDYLYGQVDSLESINQATQLYVFASQLLGPLPEEVPAPQQPAEYSYAQIRSQLDAFSNFYETMENEFPYAGPVTANPSGQSGGLLGMTNVLFFCIPGNQQLLQYWSKVSGRLYNIRHCLNLAGVPQQLALFQAPANPLALIEAAAEGIDPGSVLAVLSAPLPNYRFSYLIAKAAEYTSICQAFGKELLEALEKYDTEGLALLRAAQEITVQGLVLTQKQDQLKEAQANVAALTAARAVPVTKYQFYQALITGGSPPAAPAIGQNIPVTAIPAASAQQAGGVTLLPAEQSELTLSAEAALLHAGAGLLQVLASTEAMAPTVSIGLDVQPFGTGSNMSVSFGGSNVAASTEAVVHGMETLANYLTYMAWSAGRMSGHSRRQQEWTLQSNQAAAEIMQIDQQITAANIRVTIAGDELSVTQAQLANAQAVQSYLTAKFTSQQLYSWLMSSVSSLYSQIYQLAFSTAQQAEIAYQRELGVPQSSYITFGYWDSLRKGLLAGDRLQLAIKQLERAYLDGNQREFEVTRHVSLLLHDPAALMALKTTGECVVQLPEQLFDMDYPGQYLRRLRDVSLTIPCVAGPYTNVNCTLTLVSSKVRADPGTTGTGPAGYVEKQGGDPRFTYFNGSTAAIATSHAQDDSGVFTVNFRDERYLPFETAGAVSTWMITMPPACNAFDFDTITDVVLKLSYTARYGGDLMRGQAFAAATLPALPQQTPAAQLGAPPAQPGRDRLFSVKHEFPTGWYGLLHPSNSTAAYGQVPLWISAERFPFQYRGRTIKTADIEVFALLSTGATMTSLTVLLTPAPWPAPASPPVPPAPPVPDPAADAVSLSAQPLYGTSALYGVRAQPSPAQVPQLWWLSVATADLADAAAQIEDFFVMFHYSVA